jgi:hypothetical protein
LIPFDRKLTAEERENPEFQAFMVALSAQLAERLQKDLPKL